MITRHLTLCILVSLLFTSCVTSRNATESSTVPVKIDELLSDYSQNIGNLADKKFLQSKNYSPEMKILIIDRQNYYQEFFEKGLHSVLVGLESQFITDKEAPISIAGNLYKVHTFEQVTMRGKPIVTSPDDYPLIQAAKWAITQTNRVEVKIRLNEYIDSMTDGVEESAVQEVKIVFLVNHDMEIRVENGQATILKDTFSDKSSDNGEGFDNVIWTKNQFTRIKPDWQKMPDYQIYNTPIETIGRNLLKDYSGY